MATVRSGEKLVYSTRWFDGEADQSDRPQHISLEIVIGPSEADERHEALARRQTLFSFLKREARPSY